MNLKDLLANPVVKTAVTTSVGAAAAALDGALQSYPSGGAQSWFVGHPWAIPVFFAVQQLAHNFLSKYAPPTTLVTKAP